MTMLDNRTSKYTMQTNYRLFRLVSIFLISALYLFVLSCRKGDSPHEVADTFLGYYGSNEFNKAKDYGTEETVRVLDMMAGLNKMLPDSAVVETKFEIVSEKTEGNVATVMYKASGSNESPKPLTLVKEEGKWKVSMNKESLNEPLISGDSKE